MVACGQGQIVSFLILLSLRQRRRTLALVLEPTCAGYCSAQHHTDQFSFDARELAQWADRALRANLTYYCVRRAFFADFVRCLDAENRGPRVDVDEETFFAVWQYLTGKNDRLSDDKVLSFDKAVLDLLSQANSALRGGAPGPGGGAHAAPAGPDPC